MQASLMRCFLFLRFFAVTGVCRFRWRNPEGVRLRSGEHLGTVGFDYVTKVGTMAKTMEANAEDLSHTAKTLELLKNNLERTQREYNTMINQRPR